PGDGCRRPGPPGARSRRRGRGGIRSGRGRALAAGARTPPTAGTRLRCRKRWRTPRLRCGAPRRSYRHLPLALLRLVGEGRLSHPGVLLPRPHLVLEALPVHGAVAFDDVPELVPVDLAEVVVATLLVPPEVRIREGEAEVLGLRDGHVDELLAEVVVGDPLDLPRHRLLGVGGVGIGRAEHHQSGPPPAV